MMKQLISTFFTTTMLYGLVHMSIFSNLIETGDNRELTKKKEVLHWSNDSNYDDKSRKALIISTAPRTIKHVVALWSELECFTTDVDYVIISGPLWSEPILQQIVHLAKDSIPAFATTQLLSQVFVNDRYDVGLWCDALEWMNQSGDLANMHQVGLLNDSVFALREYSDILSALEIHNASMSSLSYSFNRPEGTGSDMFWVESIWRGFDRPGLQSFMDYSCRPATDPMFCSNRWWGKKGCIVENFERNLVRQYPRDNVVGMFSSDVPKDMLTRKHNFPNWVRHPPYWQKLVDEEGFPVSKVNWPDMIESIDDERLKQCSKYLDRSTLDGIDFSVAVKAI
ncbi:hypothetical protein IV203_012249 [Nitzschia inconspicua]|uniref:Uncharacterized protein n=1 Tax=Nitzschia inconspicua TaxID=303405 RepID=A0A9K3KTT0_9STRA|nr:hypothetical protein IV203_012249 [Nitzschia inconspicua]